MQKSVDEKPRAAEAPKTAAPEPEAPKAAAPKEKTFRVVGVNASTGQAVLEEVEE